MDWMSAAFAAAVVFGGAWVRGYSGFGSGMIWVGGLSIVFPPLVVVPTIFLLDLAASVHLVPRVWRQADWRSLRWILAGMLLATPFGIQILASLPAPPLRAAIALVVLVSAALLWKGFTWRSIPGPLPAGLAGTLCGFFGGGIAIGGPPVILFYFSSPAPVAVSRASVIIVLCALDLMAGTAAAAKGLYTQEVAWLALLLVVPTFAGIVIGHRGFQRSDPERFRRFVLLLLAFLAVAVFLRAILG
jgi:uncharacterized membrane protein YfcA